MYQPVTQLDSVEVLRDGTLRDIKDGNPAADTAEGLPKRLTLQIRIDELGGLISSTPGLTVKVAAVPRRRDTSVK